MTFEKALNLPVNEPILLIDGKLGLVIRWAPPDEIGIQVPGEEDIRWLNVSDVSTAGYNALIEREKLDDYCEVP